MSGTEFNYKSLLAYKKAYALSMEIFFVTKSFPREELYSLTDQIRRSSRSVSSSIAEAYRKRKYPAHFVSKLSDADMENSETGVWLDYAFDCGYIKADLKEKLQLQNVEVGRLLAYMMKNPEKFSGDVSLLKEDIIEYETAQNKDMQLATGTGN
jgi:four helix bundle protein